jgi:hypothetical protein
VALKTPPIIKYRLDFGMLPGGITSVITAPIVAFVNYLVNIVLVGMLLWPKRITVRRVGTGGPGRAGEGQDQPGSGPKTIQEDAWGVGECVLPSLLHLMYAPAVKHGCAPGEPSYGSCSCSQTMASLLLLPPQVPLLSWNGFLPANDPDIDTDVERLEGRPQGVVKVSVIRAKDLKSFDVVTGEQTMTMWVPRMWGWGAVHAAMWACGGRGSGKQGSGVKGMQLIIITHTLLHSCSCLACAVTLPLPLPLRLPLPATN